VIKLINDKNAEPWNVSRQRLSKCHPGMDSVKPWIGHSKRMRQRRVLQKTQTSGTDRNSQARNGQSTVSVQSGSSEKVDATPQSMLKTRSGRVVNKPLRFRDTLRPGARHVKEGEVVRPDQDAHGSGHT